MAGITAALAAVAVAENPEAGVLSEEGGDCGPGGRTREALAGITAALAAATVAEDQEGEGPSAAGASGEAVAVTMAELAAAALDGPAETAASTDSAAAAGPARLTGQREAGGEQLGSAAAQGADSGAGSAAGAQQDAKGAALGVAAKRRGSSERAPEDMGPGEPAGGKGPAYPADPSSPGAVAAAAAQLGQLALGPETLPLQVHRPAAPAGGRAIKAEPAGEAPAAAARPGPEEPAEEHISVPAQPHVDKLSSRRSRGASMAQGDERKGPDRRGSGTRTPAAARSPAAAPARAGQAKENRRASANKQALPDSGGAGGGSAKRAPHGGVAAMRSFWEQASAVKPAGPAGAPAGEARHRTAAGPQPVRAPAAGPARRAPQQRAAGAAARSAQQRSDED